MAAEAWYQIEPQLLSYGLGRRDAVADALRRFYERVQACDCRHSSCPDCKADKDAIIDAWNASAPAPVVDELAAVTRIGGEA